jgi:hypothetical protein
VTDLPIIRTSERRDFKRCPQRWYWAWRMGLRGKYQSVGALWFGTGIHLALAEWYCGPGLRRGPHPVETWLEYAKDEESKLRVAAGDGWSDDVWVEAKTLGVVMLEEYVNLYGKDDSWHIIAPEQSFQLIIPKRSGAADLAIYAGTFDLVYRDLEDDSLWLGEHKTAKAISIAHLPLDDQAGSYWAVASKVLEDAGVLQKGDSIKGIMYNFLKKAEPDDRPMDEQGRRLNQNGTISKRQPKPNFLREPVERTRAERRTMIKRIQNEAMWMDAARKRPDTLFKTPTFNCSWDCSFYDMCTLHENGTEDWREYAKAVFKVQDPYADHRKSADE